MAFNRSRTRIAVTVTAVVAAALAVGAGTADAGTRLPWRGGHQPKPAVTATRVPSVSPTTATASPRATTSPRPSASRTRTSSPRPSSSPSATSTPKPTNGTTAGSWTPPPANGNFDYQIGAPYQPPAGVTVVSRDYTVSPAAQLYNICYVNAFQAQPGAESWWKSHHPELLLRNAAGELVVDEDWDELMLDFSTAAKRTALTGIVGGWMDQCAAKGYRAVEPDNLDSYTRSQGLLTQSQAIAYATSLSSYAHGKGLAVGQKNTADLSTANARQVGFDFAVAEECADWDECDAYTRTYGDKVIVIEYSQAGFTKACNAYGSKLSVVWRDVDVTAPGSGSYVSKVC